MKWFQVTIDMILVLSFISSKCRILVFINSPLSTVPSPRPRPRPRLCIICRLLTMATVKASLDPIPKVRPPRMARMARVLTQTKPKAKHSKHNKNNRLTLLWKHSRFISGAVQSATRVIQVGIFTAQQHQAGERRPSGSHRGTRLHWAFMPAT